MHSFHVSVKSFASMIVPTSNSSKDLNLSSVGADFGIEVSFGFKSSANIFFSSGTGYEADDCKGTTSGMTTESGISTTNFASSSSKSELVFLYFYSIYSSASSIIL